MGCYTITREGAIFSVDWDCHQVICCYFSVLWQCWGLYECTGTEWTGVECTGIECVLLAVLFLFLFVVSLGWTGAGIFYVLIKHLCNSVSRLIWPRLRLGFQHFKLFPCVLLFFLPAVGFIYFCCCCCLVLVSAWGEKQTKNARF